MVASIGLSNRVITKADGVDGRLVARPKGGVAQPTNSRQSRTIANAMNFMELDLFWVAWMVESQDQTF